MKFTATKIQFEAKFSIHKVLKIKVLLTLFSIVISLGRLTKKLSKTVTKYFKSFGTMVEKTGVMVICLVDKIREPTLKKLEP